jgi:hypothetical protein
VLPESPPETTQPRFSSRKTWPSTPPTNARDAPGVEQLRLRVEERRVLARPAAAEAEEDLAALGEEGALLLEERLERGEVDHDGVHLDLPEVRVDGADEGHAAADPDLEVEPRAPVVARAVVPGVRPRRGGDELGPPRHVREELDVPPGLDTPGEREECQRSIDPVEALRYE